VKKSLLARWRANFLTGLIIVLPGLISLGVLFWLFGSVTNVTDRLFFPKYFLDPVNVYQDGKSGPLLWYWSLLALVFAVALICAVGLAARNYFGKKMIEWVDMAMMHVPFLNKIYGATKQVNDALVTGNKNSFKTVVLIEFPHSGSYSLGFLTSEDAEIRVKPDEKLVCVFVPTTPNPTSGFMMLVPDQKVMRLRMSVADGLKYIISLGSISPDIALVDKKIP
jgi:uncharacterized membrane protein